MRSLRLALALLLLLTGCDRASGPTVYQYAAFAAFASGNYAGTLPLAGLKAHGDFGLGTFDSLNGEMIVLDGVVYRADLACHLSQPSPTELLPFAEVVFFKPEAGEAVGGSKDLAQLGAWLDARLPEGGFAAAKVKARFKSLTIRSVPGFTPPYPPFPEALKAQRVLELKDVSGTLVGLRGPAMQNGVWIPGWHFHFVSADAETGGHVLELEGLEGQAAWMASNHFELELPGAKRP
jgi:acetolactate decarboxylase